MANVHIVGAGLSGLLTANMLRHRSPIVHEVQPSLPNNHSAILRFRTSAVGDVLNIPFKKVTMIKTHVPWRNTVADALVYSHKTNGTYRSDRSITVGLVASDRWIAPPDLIARMAEGLDIRFQSDFKKAKYKADDYANQQDFPGLKHPLISTIPMPILANELKYVWPGTRPEFNSVPGLNIRATIEDCDAYISLLVPDPSIPFSRISITGNELIVECSLAKSEGTVRLPSMMTSKGEKNYLEMCVSVAAEMLGIPAVKFHDLRCYPQKYAKITPIDDDVRKTFMHWATVTHNVYSLGRFATWRPQTLMDDLIQDIRKIDGWIGKSSKYDLARDR